MVLRAILFDKDGTLIDFDKTWGPAAYEVMRHLARDDEPGFSRLCAVSEYDVAARRFSRTSPLVAGATAHFAPLWAEALGRRDPEALAGEIDRLFRDWGRQTMVPIGTPSAIIAGLREAGYKLGIATNDAEASALLQADMLGLIPHMDAIFGYDSGHGTKPAPGMIHAFAQRVGVPEPEVALVGDSIHDLDAARAAGAVGIAVLSGPAPEEELAPHADYVIPSIEDLPDLLASLSSAATSAAPSARPSR